MKSKFLILATLLAAAAVLLSLAACTEIGVADASGDVSISNISESYIKANVTLSDNGISVRGKGISVHGSIVTITSGGRYVFSGALTNGRIIVNAPRAKVTIVLNGASIKCTYSSPVYIYQSRLTTITLSNGTTNTLADGKPYTFTDNISSRNESEPNACLYSKCDLIINGNGKLAINAKYRNGITTKDSLRISNASIAVKAKRNGINGRDCNIITDADITVNCGGDAIRSTNEIDASLGYIEISNSTLNLTAGKDAIQAATDLTVTNGIFNLTTGGGNTGKVKKKASSKGLKAGNSLTVYDGTFVIDSADDSLHSDGDITIFGGAFTMSSGDDGAHANKTLNVIGGTIDILKSFEGLEGSVVNISGGTINIVASDDGINADANDSSCAINISGGSVVIFARDDGIDSNGAINISGGRVESIINSTPDNTALDNSEGFLTVTGGTVIAGGTGTHENLSADSTQSYVYITDIPSGAKLTVTSGTKTLATYTANRNIDHLVIFAPGITSGQTYDVSINENTIPIIAGIGGAPDELSHE